tara:strand:- start:24929 stop:25327 length:399 start_codon:yes stop_codon:yes gene_type:complete
MTNETAPYLKAITFCISWLADQASDEKWTLSDEEVCQLLGGIPLSSWHEWKEMAKDKQQFELNQDVIDRLVLLLKIHESIAMSAPSGAIFDFFKRPISHPTFEGKSAKESLLLDNSMDNLNKIMLFFRSRIF